MKKGFTLAEVLITLAIIGVVAAMTIPTLMNNYQKTVYLTQLKKFNSAFQNGIKTYMANQGCLDLACTGLFEGQITDAQWKINILKAENEIFKVSKEFPAGSSRNINTLGNPNSVSGFGRQVVTLDGFDIYIEDWDAGNCTYYTNITSSSKLKNACAVINVDINGEQKPNKGGRDFFVFYLANDGMLYPFYGIDFAKAFSNTENYKASPVYWGNGSNSCGTLGSDVIDPTTTGWGCSARILEEGWQMNY